MRESKKKNRSLKYFYSEILTTRLRDMRLKSCCRELKGYFCSNLIKLFRVLIYIKKLKPFWESFWIIFKSKFFKILFVYLYWLSKYVRFEFGGNRLSTFLSGAVYIHTDWHISKHIFLSSKRTSKQKSPQNFEFTFFTITILFLH